MTFPVVTNWHIDLPVVYYSCPACGKAREITINRWERGGCMTCLGCREIYRLPIGTG